MVSPCFFISVLVCVAIVSQLIIVISYILSYIVTVLHHTRYHDIVSLNHSYQINYCYDNDTNRRIFSSNLLTL